jgi:hypothetical protein
MATPLLRRLVCVFRKHQWRIEHNRETQGTEADCLRCGAHRSTYPGATDLQIRNPGAGHDGLHSGGGVAGDSGGSGGG